MKRIVFLGILLLIVVRAHGKAAPAAPAAASAANYSVAVTASASNSLEVAEPRTQSTSEVASQADDQGVLEYPEALLAMSEPKSLTLLGVVLLLIVGITRFLPAYLRQKQVKLRNAWHVVSSFFF